MKGKRAVDVREVVDLLEPGMTIFVPGLSGESLAFFEKLKAVPHKANGVRFAGVHFPGVNLSDYVGLHPNATQRSYFMQPHLRPAIEQGRVELMPLDYPGAFDDLRLLPIDVAIAQVSIPDSGGAMSLGTTCDFLPAVWQQARIKVALVNPRMPRTSGSFQIGVNDCDLICETDAPLVVYDGGAAGSDLLEIARHAAGQIRDGDTLQLGIGKLPSCVLQALEGHRSLRIHSGMITEAALPLVDRGVIAGVGAIATGTALGGDAFYHRLDKDRTFYFRPVAETHDVRRIAEIPSFVSINSAVEVDLFGQVNCDCLDGRLIAGVGGMPAFVQGAQLSRNGRAIFCLSATAAKGKLSRIVSVLGHRSLVGLPRHAIDTLVTEYGIAHLRGLSVHARAKRVIELAAPEFRDGLAAQWAQIRQRL